MNRLKKLIITILVICSLVSIVFIIYKIRSNNKPSEPNSISRSATYGNLQPGVSTLDDITKQLGTSEKETASGSGKILEYKSKNPNFNNEVTVQSGKLSFVKQIIAYKENTKVSDLNQKYGIYENVLYGPSSANGYNLYVYPDKGIAYIGNQGADILLEIWYFTPTTLENFKALYANDYSDKYIQRGQ